MISEKCKTTYAKLNTFVTNVINRDVTPKIDSLRDGKEDNANKVTSLSSSSTDTQYPSAKAVFDSLPSVPNASSVTPNADTTNGSVGDGTTWARSNHTHPKSSLYAEASHTHSQYLTSHQDITGKVDKSNGASKMTDISAYSNLVTSANATQKTINNTIDTEILNLQNSLDDKRNISRAIVNNADYMVEEGHYYQDGGIVNTGQNQGMSFLDVSVNPRYDNMITQVCYEYDYGEFFDDDVHQYIRYSTDGGANWSSWKRFAEESEINSLNTSITNLADTTKWKYYINNSNYKVRYNDYRVNVDISITGTSATTSLTSYGAEIIPPNLRPKFPVGAFSHDGNVLVQIKDNDTKLYRKSMTGNSLSNINIYAHLEWDRR